MEPVINQRQLEELVKKLVKDVLTEMLGLNTIAHQKQWYDTDQAYKFLDLDSEEQLRKLVRSGILRIGIEVRDVRSPNSQIPRYQFHIEKCEIRLATAPEKRRIKKSAA